jgi:hypothetical protein
MHSGLNVSDPSSHSHLGQTDSIPPPPPPLPQATPMSVNTWVWVGRVDSHMTNMLPWQPHPMVTIHPWNWNSSLYIALALVLSIKLAAFAVASYTTHSPVG